MVDLAYYPPYHSKYTPIERWWGSLEHHWNRSILDTVEAVLKFTASRSWRSVHPVVALVSAVYDTGVKLSKAAMADIEGQIARRRGLAKWFVDIIPAAARDG
jgi:hypothetical protein